MVSFIALVILILLFIKKDGQRIPFSFSDLNSLRGVFALLILIFHISKESDPFYPLFHYFSIVVVGAFFFISGYGLMKSYLSDSSYYISFPKKRFYNVVLPYLIMTLVYWLYYSLTGEYYSFREVFHRIITYSPIVMYSWFIISIILHYLYFYLLMRICKKKTQLFTGIFAGFLLLYFLMIFFKIHPDTNYPDPLFCLGIIYGFYEERILQNIRRHEATVIRTSFVVILLSFILVSFIHDGDFASLVKKVVFVLICFIFTYLFSFKKSLLCCFGKISLEIYMFQGLSKLIIRRFFGGPLFIQDLLVFILCFVLSYFFHIVFHFLQDRFRHTASLL